MKLAQASNYFDRDSVYDSYTGVFAFKGQFSSYDANSMDGGYQRRRTLSVAPGIELPPRHALRVHGEDWLSGILMADGFFDKPIRRSSTCMVVTDTYQLLSPRATVLGEAGYAVMAHNRYRRDSTESVRSSDMDSVYDIYLASTETVPTGFFLRGADKLYFIRNTHDVAEGFTVAGADEIYNRVGPGHEWSELWDYDVEVEVTLIGPVDPITEQPGVSVTTSGILMDIQKLFRQGTERSPNIVDGDRALLIRNDIALPQNLELTIKGRAWRMVSSQPFHDTTLLHIRR